MTEIRNVISGIRTYEDGQHRFDRTWLLISTWWAYAGFYFCRKVFYVVKKDFGDALGFSPEVLGEIGAVYLIAYACGQFSVSYLSRYFSPKKILLTGMALSMSANIGFAYATIPLVLKLLVMTNGFAQATGWPSLMGILVNWTQRSERGWLMGLWATCYQIGSVLASAWAAYWLSHGGYQMAFWMASAVLMAVFVLNLLCTHEQPQFKAKHHIADRVIVEHLHTDVVTAEDNQDDDDSESQRSGEDENEAAPSGLWVTVACVGLFYFGVKFVRYALWSWTPFFLQSNFGLANDSAGYLSTVFDFFGFLGVISAGWISDRFFKSQRSGVALVLIFGLLCGTVCLYFFGRYSLPLFTVIFAFVGFCLFGPDALLTGAGVLDLGGRARATQIAGFVNGLGSLGAVAQEIVIARVYGSSHNLGRLLLILVCAALLSFVALTIQRVRVARGTSRF